MSSKQTAAGGNKRTKTTEKRLKMYATRAKRDKHGKVVWEAFKSKSTDHTARIQPDRRWFGPSRTATPEAIDKFREQVKNVVDPYHESKDADPSNTNPAPLTPGSTVARHTYLLKQAKIPYSLLHTRDHFPNAINNRILDVESYSSTFGPKNTRKRPKLAVSDYSELLKRVESTQENYKEGTDRNIKVEQEYKEQQGDAVLTAGQSNRIHNELHKVIDASDVLIQVLDARDPEGTRSRWLEKYLRKEHPHKHLVLLLNKCDLVPQKVTKQWLGLFSREYPCLAFHASLQRPFGKGALIQILRQFQQLHAKDKQQISVGFVGYPNVGKSSVINTLRHKKVCNVAPIPGETKVWQYITLFKRVFLIDCPGVITAIDVAQHNHVLEDQFQLEAREQVGNVVSEKEAALVLKGVVRIENLTDPVSYIGPLLTRVNPEYLQRVYQCEVNPNHVIFLENLAKKSGKLLKGGHPDITRVARIVLNDWLRGKIPFYNKPSGIRNVSSSEAEQLHAPSQLLENIPVKEEFKELFADEDENEAVVDDTHNESANDDESANDEHANNDEDEDEDEDEAPIDWDAVYASVNPEQDFNTIHAHENQGAKNSSVGLPKTADLPKLELHAPIGDDDEEPARGRARGQGKVPKVQKEKKQRGKIKKKSQVKSEDEMKDLLRTLESIEGKPINSTHKFKNRNAQNKKKRARSEQTEDFEIVPQESRVKRRKLTPQ